RLPSCAASSPSTTRARQRSTRSWRPSRCNPMTRATALPEDPLFLRVRRGLLWLAGLTSAGIAVELAVERHWTQPGQLIAWGALAQAAMAVLLATVNKHGLAASAGLPPALAGGGFAPSVASSPAGELGTASSVRSRRVCREL